MEKIFKSMMFKELSLPNELWIPVADTDGKYYVSNLGRAISTECGEKKLIKVVKQSNSKGYLRVGIKKDNVYKPVNTHRLVAQSFIPNPNNLQEVNHIDGVKTNNHVTNLEWVSHLQTYCDNINNQRQSTTGYKPIELWKPEYKQVRTTQLPNPDLKPTDLSNDAELRQRIESRITNKAKAVLASQKAHQFHIGDFVRVKLITIDSKYRKRNKDGKWEKKKTAIQYSPRLYRISKVLRKSEAQGQKYYLEIFKFKMVLCSLEILWFMYIKG
jgi:Rps23 Pro-64 3,4-dihydroxylase Tpa1-like proline 4-hydroxylase